MLDVALWSKYPESFVEAKIEPALEKRGIRVVKHLSERTKQMDLSGVAAVLYLHEMTSHSEHYRINNLAQAQGRKVISLSRKQAQWDRNLRPLYQSITENSGEEMATPRAVPDNKVADLCNTYMDLYKRGTPRKEMIAPLQKFWTTELTNESQLDMQMRSLVSSGRAPAQFRQWFERGRKKDRRALAAAAIAPVVQQAPATAQKVNGTATKTNGHRVIEASQLPPASPAQAAQKAPELVRASTNIHPEDKEVLDKMLQEESEKLEKMRKDLEARMVESNKQLEELKAENAKLRSQSALGDGKLRRVLANVTEAVDLNLMSKDEAFIKLTSFIKN